MQPLKMGADNLAYLPIKRPPKRPIRATTVTYCALTLLTSEIPVRSGTWPANISACQSVTGCFCLFLARISPTRLSIYAGIASLDASHLDRRLCAWSERSGAGAARRSPGSSGASHAGKADFITTTFKLPVFGTHKEITSAMIALLCFVLTVLVSPYKCRGPA